MKTDMKRVLNEIKAGTTPESIQKVKAIHRVKMSMIEDYDLKIHTLQPLLRQAQRNGYVQGLNDALDWVEKFNQENKQT